MRITDMLANLRENDRKLFLMLRHKQRKAYLETVQAVGIMSQDGLGRPPASAPAAALEHRTIGQYDISDELFLDKLDAQLVTLFDRAGRYMVPDVSQEGFKAVAEGLGVQAEND